MTPAPHDGAAPGRLGGAAWRRSSTVAQLPADPAGEAVADAIAEILEGASVELVYSPHDAPPTPSPVGAATASATGAGPPGWRIRATSASARPAPAAVTPESIALLELLTPSRGPALRAAARFRLDAVEATPRPSARRCAGRCATRSSVETLGRDQTWRCGRAGRPASCIAETIEYLIELSGTRVESQDLTHGVVIADVLQRRAAAGFRYPADLRAAKRAPLLFDGQRSLLVVDRAGPGPLRAAAPPPAPPAPRRGAARRRRRPSSSHSGSLVAEATRRLGGLGFFLRADRSIWAFAGGQPLLVRRGEHWTAFPLELHRLIANIIGGGRGRGRSWSGPPSSSRPSARAPSWPSSTTPTPSTASCRPRTATTCATRSTRRPCSTETRLHHLIDAEELDAQTLARLAALDGATIVDRAGHLLAYGAIVTSSDSQHEGARTAAAKTLSQTADDRAQGLRGRRHHRLPRRGGRRPRSSAAARGPDPGPQTAGAAWPS